mgnify:CR=1 FL=1
MKHDLTTRKYERRARKLYDLFSCLVLALTVMVVPAFAADDPLTVVNNLSEFIFSLIRATGLILLGFGVLPLGPSPKIHHPPQQAHGIPPPLCGVVLHFTKGVPPSLPRPRGQTTKNTPAPFQGSGGERGCCTTK